MSTLARIQTLIKVGKRPIGLRPPSGLGKSTISTRCRIAGHCPQTSMAMKMAHRKVMSLSERRLMALGEMLSDPRPVPMGKDIAACLTKWFCSGCGGRHSESLNLAMYCECSFHSNAQLSASCSTAAWLQSGVKGSLNSATASLKALVCLVLKLASTSMSANAFASFSRAINFSGLLRPLASSALKPPESPRLSSQDFKHHPPLSQIRVPLP